MSSNDMEELFWSQCVLQRPFTTACNLLHFTIHFSIITKKIQIAEYNLGIHHVGAGY